ncbi:MAG: response regulator transcription factor [Rhodospirillaceae bacterium]|nr:response regulator transcription factor [Rhodospirillaceae bacterium]
MPRNKILVVEDDTAMADTVKDVLSSAGFDVTTAETGAQAGKAMAQTKFDLCIVDLRLPDIDGFELVKRMRAIPGTGVIILSAASDLTDRVVGLEVGADDYIQKPFNGRELIARVKSLLRRLSETYTVATDGAAQAPSYDYGIFQFDVAGRTITKNGEKSRLTTTEFNLLKALVERPHCVLTRSQLLDLVYADNNEPAFDRSIDVTVNRLRRKIEDDPTKPDMIQTIRNGGYLFAPPK